MIDPRFAAPPPRSIAAIEAESLRRGRMLLRLRDALIHVTDGMDDQGDVVAFGSTNDADALRDAVRWLDDFSWEQIVGEGDRSCIFALAQQAQARADAAATSLAALSRPRPLSEWHEDMGNCLWWFFPVSEAPYVGSPLDCGRTCEITLRLVGEEHVHHVNIGGWPGYHTHFTPLPAAPKASAAAKGVSR